MAERRRGLREPTTAAKIGTIESDASALDRAIAADRMLRHLFVPPAQPMPGIRYAAYYRFAEKHSGGDIVDVYRCSDGAANLSLTDISGKGVAAALHAGLVKYGIRAYSTEQHAPKDVLRWLNRFYKESDAFERSDSFASVFFARYRQEQRQLCYASAGHEGIVLFEPGADGIALPPTGPLVGVFDDAADLYGDRELRVESGTTLVAVSDGVTEARYDDEFFGMNRVLETAARLRDRSLEDLVCGLTREAGRFARNRIVDDMAVLAVTFL